MATCPQYPLLPWIMKILFCSPFLLLFSFPCFPGKIQASETQFHTINISHKLSTMLTCVRTLNNTGLRNRLEVVNIHGPCAHDQEDSKKMTISLADILIKDQQRLKSIQAAARTNKQKLQQESLNFSYYPNNNPKLPVVGDMDIHEYTVNIGLGTPVRNLTLMFDTGSDVMWTQCRPCLEHCYRQKKPIFNPSASTTYSNISCNSPECWELKKYEGRSGCYRNSTCMYSEFYGDGSYTKGFYSRDTLTIKTHATITDVFPGFRFGCGQNNSDGFGTTDGLLGLGRGPASFVSQTKTKYSGLFSYCLHPDMSSTGFLSFGVKFNNNNKKKKIMVITPLIPSPPSAGFPTSILYYIEITAISVGETRLKIKESIFKAPGTIIDSGMTVTRLPPAAYKALCTEFKKQMTNKVFKHKIAPAYSILDTCFHITKNIANVPTISFTFKGNATLPLDPSGILVVINKKRACLAFAGNENSTDLAVFGNTQQLNYEVMYDVPGNQLGFLKNTGCL